MKKTIQRAVHVLLLAAAAFAVSGCQRMEPGQYGVIFRALPTWMGGGVGKKTIQPGEMKYIVWPWEKIYRMETTIRSLSWGGPGQEDSVETRALDGNEVGLALTIQYRLDHNRLKHVVEKIGDRPEDVERLIATVARADIRTHMNILRTQDFFSPEKRKAAVDQVKEALQTRLGPEGIMIESVIYNDHRFERRLPDGTVDRSYQEQIDRTQGVNQQTEQERKKVATVIEQKRREFHEAQARVNRMREQVEGFKKQATLKGDSYKAAKLNEAEQVRTVGMAEVEGLKRQVEALKGPGGRALLRLAIVRELLNSNPKFVVLNSGGKGAGAIDFNRIDANELIRQAGIFVSSPEMQQEKKNEKQEQKPAPAQSEAAGRQ